MNNTSMHDFNDVEEIEISISEDKIWINVDGRCKLRAYKVKHIIIDDRRQAQY